MKIAEIYGSIQGEGQLTGTPSVFVRTSGCNLRCSFCDTPYTSWRPEGEDLAVDDIADRVLRFEESHVVLTGGEPMMFAELIPLAGRLRQAGRHVTVETAGTLYLPLPCDLMSISPKMSNSAPDSKRHPTWYRRHEQTRMAPAVVERLIQEYAYQLKFVVGSPTDVEEVEAYLARHATISRSHVWLMPEGTCRERLSEIERWLAPYCQQQQLQFCPRRHIEWFGHARAS